MLPNINLMPKYERQSSAYFIIIVGLFVIWLLLLAYLIFQYVTTNGEIDRIQAKSEELNLEKIALEKQLAERAEEQEETHEDAVRFASQLVLPTSVLIHELIRNLPDNGYLTQYSYTNGEVEIDTQFEEMNDGADYIVKLVDSKNVKDAVIDELVTFEHGVNGAAIRGTAYQIVPRYQMVYSLEVNRHQLREEMKQNE